MKDKSKDRIPDLVQVPEDAMEDARELADEEFEGVVGGCDCGCESNRPKKTQDVQLTFSKIMIRRSK